MKKLDNFGGQKEINSLFHVHIYFLGNFYSEECCSKNSQQSYFKCYRLLLNYVCEQITLTGFFFPIVSWRNLFFFSPLQRLWFFFNHISLLSLCQSCTAAKVIFTHLEAEETTAPSTAKDSEEHSFLLINTASWIPRYRGCAALSSVTQDFYNLLPTSQE